MHFLVNLKLSFSDDVCICFLTNASVGDAKERLTKIEESMVVWEGKMHPLMGTPKVGMFVCARHDGRLYRSTVSSISERER